jgi:hypothetical protein
MKLKVIIHHQPKLKINSNIKFKFKPLHRPLMLELTFEQQMDNHKFLVF